MAANEKHCTTCGHHFEHHKRIGQSLICELSGCPCSQLIVSKIDPVNHPPHYTSHPSGVECIEVTRHMTFNLGNAVKYIWRAGDKGKEIEDLEKARWYIDDEIKRLKGDTNGK